MSIQDSRGTSRSEFLKRTAGGAIAVAGAGVGAGVFARSAAAATTSGRFGLELDGVVVGALASASGGNRSHSVSRDPIGSDGVQRKSLGQPKYEDFTIQVGSGMSKHFYQWLNASMSRGSVRKSGAIVAADFNYREVARRSFSNAIITEVTIPALDAESTVPANITVRFSPQSVTDAIPTGSLLDYLKKKDKSWLTQNFRFHIAGLDTSRVASIDSFTWKQSFVVDTMPPVINVSDLGIYIKPGSRASWQEWYDNFAVGGDATDERGGTLTLLGTDGAAVLLRLPLSNLGIYHIEPVIVDVTGGTARRVKAEMYCESMKFIYKGSGF